MYRFIEKGACDIVTFKMFHSIFPESGLAVFLTMLWEKMGSETIKLTRNGKNATLFGLINFPFFWIK